MRHMIPKFSIRVLAAASLLTVVGCGQDVVWNDPGADSGLGAAAPTTAESRNVATPVEDNLVPVDDLRVRVEDTVSEPVIQCAASDPGSFGSLDTDGTPDPLPPIERTYLVATRGFQSAFVEKPSAETMTFVQTPRRGGGVTVAVSMDDEVRLVLNYDVAGRTGYILEDIRACAGDR